MFDFDEEKLRLAFPGMNLGAPPVDVPQPASQPVAEQEPIPEQVLESASRQQPMPQVPQMAAEMQNPLQSQSIFDNPDFKKLAGMFPQESGDDDYQKEMMEKMMRSAYFSDLGDHAAGRSGKRDVADENSNDKQRQ